MKKIVIILIVFLAGIFLGWGYEHYRKCNGHRKIGSKLEGTDLQFSGQVGSINVYSGRNANTNEFAVFRGNECLISVLKDESDGIWKITHFENGMSVLITTRQADLITKRMFFSRDAAGKDLFTYYDRNGDGQWDVLLDFSSRKRYLRQGNAWNLASPGGE